jgi:hypothetical protein
MVFCRPLRGLSFSFDGEFPALKRWAIFGRPLRGRIAFVTLAPLLPKTT